MATLIDSAALAALAGVTTGQAAALPAAVTAIAERHCGRPLALADRDEEHAPGVGRVVRLEGRPIVGAARVSIDPADCLTLVNTSGAWRASAALSGSTLTLRQVVAGVESSQELALSGFPTVEALAAAAGALEGWSATVAPGMGPCPTAELRATPGELDANGRPAALQAFRSAAGPFELNPRTGRLTLAAGFPEAYRFPDRSWGLVGGGSLVRVRYRSGYSADPEDGSPTPPDLAEACLALARGVLDSREVSGVASYVNLGNLSYTAGSPEVLAAVTPNARRLLSPYVDRRC